MTYRDALHIKMPRVDVEERKDVATFLNSNGLIKSEIEYMIILQKQVILEKQGIPY